MNFKTIFWFFCVVILKFKIFTNGQDQCGRQSPSNDTDFVGFFDDDEKHPVGYWPWMASLGFYDEGKKWKHQCGATLVTERHFLTAAHCAKKEFKIRIGDTNHASAHDDRNAVDLDIYNLTIHPKYNAPISYYDVAILETSPVTFSKFISPICLPQFPSNYIHKYSNVFVDLIGWGQENIEGKTSDKLSRLSLNIFPPSFCDRALSTDKINEVIAEKLPQLIQNQIICAGADSFYYVGSQGSCKGNAGGPLMYKETITDQWIQIAAVHGAIRDCADLEYPGLYIRLDDPNILSFIRSVLNLNYNVIEYKNNTNGFLKYEGEIQNGEPFGKGTMAYKNRTSYEGQWIAGKRNGNGTYYWIYSVYNVIYNGEWKNDLKNGFGKEDYLYSRYEGQWKDGKRAGNGTYTYYGKTKYVGEWKNHLRNGIGKESYFDGKSFDGDYYEGEWKDDEKSGNGTYIWADGRKYVGEFKNNSRNGFGNETYLNGESYEGEWKDDERSGNGIYVWADGRKYVGEFKNDSVVITLKKNGNIMNKQEMELPFGTMGEDMLEDGQMT